MNLSDLKLNENPFRIGPPLNNTKIIWVGFPDLKQKIDNRITFAMKTSPSRIVINWGRYGSGKTHAANYYSKRRSLEISQELGLQPAINIKLVLPRTSKDPVQSLLRNFLGQISLKNIKSDFDSLEEFFTREQIIQIIESISNDNIITEVFKKVISADSDEVYHSLEAYLFGDTTKGTLSSLGLPSGLKDDEQVVNFLSTYINCITYEKKLYSSFVMWLDEFEDIDTLNKISQDRFTTFLRQLFDKAPNNFLLFLNFTPKTFYNIEDLSITLGEALTTRAKLQIVFEPAKPQEAKQYINELLNDPSFRDQPSGFSPFTEEAVEYLLQNIGILSVRKINEVFSLILEMALMTDTHEINKEFINQSKDEMISWEG